MNKWTSSLDANHNEIVKNFRDRGVAVIDTSKVGDGFPDLIIKVGLISALVEIKVPGGMLSTKQQKWHNEHQTWLVFVVHDEDEVDWVVAKLKELQNISITITGL